MGHPNLIPLTTLLDDFFLLTRHLKLSEKFNSLHGLLMVEQGLNLELSDPQTCAPSTISCHLLKDTNSFDSYC